MRRKKQPKIQMTRVSRCSWDGSKDYQIPLTRAKELYEQGKLEWDLTNHMYCTPNPHPVTSSDHRKYIGPEVK
jgi:hypothetical protein